MNFYSYLILICLLSISIVSFGQDKLIGTDIKKASKQVFISEADAEILWISPNVTQNENSVTTEVAEITISFKIKSNFDFTAKDIVIYLNDALYQGKSGEIDLRKDNKRNFTVSKTIEFTGTIRDKNIIKVGVKTPYNREILADKPLEVIYSPVKVSLHILAIGPDFQDLDYTTEDANDFIATFTNQGALFKNVNTETLVGEQATFARIIGRLGAYRTLYNQNDISKNDIIIIFISAHGFTTDDGDFRIQGSDFDKNAREYTSISYRKHIIDILENVQCKKLIFIDACHSGAAKLNSEGGKAQDEDVSKALIKIMNTQSGVTTISSSKETQLSYEDKRWQNGAFTEALLEGLGGEADKNTDGIIQVQELFEYIEKRVPTLVRQVKRKEQTPIMNNNELGNLPIFIYR